MDSGIIFFCGLRGSGKTHRIRQFAIRLVTRGRRVIAFDPSGDIYSGLQTHYASRSEGARAYVERFGTVAALAGRIQSPKATDPTVPPIACVVLPRDNLRLHQAEAKAFRSLVLGKADSGIVWVSDEAELVFYGHGQTNDVFPLAILARNLNSLIVVACKDPMRVSVDLRRGADAALIFSLKTEESALAMKDVCDPSIVVQATRLKKRQFLYVPPITEENARETVYRLGPDDDLPDEL